MRKLVIDKSELLFISNNKRFKDIKLNDFPEDLYLVFSLVDIVIYKDGNLSRTLKRREKC